VRHFEPRCSASAKVNPESQPTSRRLRAEAIGPRAAHSPTYDREQKQSAREMCLAPIDQVLGLASELEELRASSHQSQSIRSWASRASWRSYGRPVTSPNRSGPGPRERAGGATGVQSPVPIDQVLGLASELEELRASSHQSQSIRSWASRASWRSYGRPVTSPNRSGPGPRERAVALHPTSQRSSAAGLPTRARLRSLHCPRG